MSLFGKKNRDPSQLPTLVYDVTLTVPTSNDSKPQEISFLDLLTNDNRFKTDKESLELVLSSYVKACGKQSVKEILSERDRTNDDKSSLGDAIRALMDFNDQQNANLGVGYNDPEDDDSFIDDSTAAQDIIPRNMTNERDGFYVNEKHEPIKARYLSESSGSESDDSEDEDDSDGSSSDDDSDDDDETDDKSSASEKEKEKEKEKDKETEKRKILNLNDSDEKETKKRKLDEEMTLTAKRKRSVSEICPPTTSVINATEINQKPKTTEEIPKKTTNEIVNPASVVQSSTSELEQEIKLVLDKLVKFILFTESSTPLNQQKKVERLFEPAVCRELLDLAKKLQRHTQAIRQIVFDSFGGRIGLCPSFLITRARSLLLSDYEPTLKSLSLNEIKDKLKIEIQKSLETHILAHNIAVKEWQIKSAENPSKDKQRGPRKNFRFNKAISELIIRCVDRQLSTFKMIDSEGLEMFLHDQIVPFWDKPGWMTAKKIINESIRMEYRALRDINPSMLQPSTITNPTTPTMPKVSSLPNTAERLKKDPANSSPPTTKSIHNSQSSPKLTPPTTATRLADPKISEHKPSANTTSTLNTASKPVEMATRVTSNPVKQTTPRPISNEIPNHSSSDLVRSMVKPAIVSPTPTPTSTAISDPSNKRVSTNQLTVIDLTQDLAAQYRKHVQENSLSTSKSLSNKETPPVQRNSSPLPTSIKQSTAQNQMQQYATKVRSEKQPTTTSHLKDALLTSNTSINTPPRTSSTKVTASPLAIDNMINKTTSQSQSPRPNSTNTTNPTTVKQTTTTSSSSQHSSSVSQHNPSSTHHSSSSSKSSAHRLSTDPTSVNNAPTKEKSTSSSNGNPSQKSKTSSSPSSSTSSSNRPPSNNSLSSNSVSPSVRRSTPAGLQSTFLPTHDLSSSRSLSSQAALTSALSSTMGWDPATLHLAAAALANPQLLNSSVFDQHIFNSVLATAAAGLVPPANSSGSSSQSSSSSRHQNSQSSNNHRRN